MSAYTAGGSGSGDTHTPKVISGGKRQPAMKATPAKVAKPAKKATPKKRGS